MSLVAKGLNRIFAKYSFKETAFLYAEYQFQMQ